ncbi:hypothetical protein [Cellulosimicrobium arenosum]|uniref:Sporulation protein n=1 Tax=Cellulosimicrobium arenosum TaxID=2708133 RepID=A0A927GA87_9MICO|nr:hypothetical protein [Cellulosimicrobium arenosum]MBD8079167.1 hypothetical protein [Cellulosimicrobium arenosum]
MGTQENTGADVDPAYITNAARDTFSVRRVFGEAYEREGTLVIPVATVWGGTGSGWGAGSGELSGKGAAGLPAIGRRPRADDGPAGDPGSGNADGEAGGEGSGGGGGFGVRVKATGVYVVDADGVRWQPSLDVNRIILGGQAVAAAVGVAAAIAWGVSRLRR